MMFSYFKIIIAFLWIVCLEVRAQRTQRFLIFPQQAPTRHQFIGGIGIPADLAYESLTEGYVLKAEFWLPYNATVFRENPFFPEYQVNPPVIQVAAKRAKRSALRWYFYDIIGKKLSSYGLNGQECLQKAICEANSLPFAQQSELFANLAHIFFSPSSSEDLDMNDSWNYREAEKQANTLLACSIYDCKISVLDWISVIFDK